VDKRVEAKIFSSWVESLERKRIFKQGGKR